MDQIGTSHITTADLLICVFTFSLILYLQKLPADSTWSRALAVVGGCAIFTVITLLFLVELHQDAVYELSFIAFALCWSLWGWNDRRVKSKAPKAVSPSNQTN